MGNSTYHIIQTFHNGLILQFSNAKVKNIYTVVNIIILHLLSPCSKIISIDMIKYSIISIFNLLCKKVQYDVHILLRQTILVFSSTMYAMHNSPISHVYNIPLLMNAIFFNGLFILV